MTEHWLGEVDKIGKAIVIDLEYTFYHTSKAIYFGYLGLINAIPGQEVLSITRIAALKALQLNPTDPEANYAIGMIN